MAQDQQLAHLLREAAQAIDEYRDLALPPPSRLPAPSSASCRSGKTLADLVRELEDAAYRLETVHG
jgi:hypothetical protein